MTRKAVPDASSVPAMGRSYGKSFRPGPEYSKAFPRCRRAGTLCGCPAIYKAAEAKVPKASDWQGRGEVARLLFAAAVFAIVPLAGCVNAPEPEVRTADPVNTIDVRSWPPGLVVELNGEYIGTTPVELVVDSTRSGNWTADFARGFGPIIMRASTSDASGWEQKIWYPGDRIPSRVLFRIPGAMKRLLAVN